MMLRWFAAAALAVLVLWAGVLAFVLAGDNYRRVLPDELLLPDPSSWRMLSGEGGLGPEGWEISGPGLYADARLGVSLGRPTLVEKIEGIEIEFEQDIEFRSIALGWSRSPTIHPRHLAAVSLKNETTASVDIDRLDQRSAEIGYLVVEVLGGFDQPLTVRTIRLLPARPGLIELQCRILGEWVEFPRWTQKSLNLTGVSGRPAVIALPMAAAIWLLLAGLFWFFLRADRSTRSLWTGMLAYTFVAWGVLDLRWQIDLLLKSSDAVETFAGKSLEERRLSDLDGELVAYIEELKSQLGPEARRVFTFGVGEYWRLRARYHAVPWSVRDVGQPLRGSWVRHLRQGDVFLLLDAQHVQVSRIDQAPGDTPGVGREFNLADIVAETAELSPSTLGGATIRARSEGEYLVRTRVGDLSAPAAYILDVQMRASQPGAQARIRLVTRDADGRRLSVVERIFEPGSSGFTALRLPFHIVEGGNVDIHVAEFADGTVEMQSMQIEPLNQPDLRSLHSSTSRMQVLVRPVLLERGSWAYEVL